MPRQVTVTFEDGSQLVYDDVPDHVTPDQVESRAATEGQKRVASIEGIVKEPARFSREGRAKSEAGMAERATSTAKSMGSAFVKGMIDVPRMVTHDAAEMLAPAIPVAGDQLRADLRKLDAPLAAAQEAIDVPATSQGDYWAQVVARGAGGGVGPGVVRAPVVALSSASGAAVGSEASAQLAGDNPLARLLGALFGGTVAGRVTEAASRRVAPNTEELAREMVEGLSAGDLAKAQSVMDEVERLYGIKLDLSQALDKPSNITAVRDVLANSKYGNRVQGMLREQPRKTIGVLNTELSDLPGEQLPSMQQAANVAQDAATQFIQRLKDQRKAEVNPMYASAGALKGTNEALVSTIDALLENTQIHSDSVRRDLVALRRDLVDQKQTRAKRMKEAARKDQPYQREPVTDAGQLNDLLKNFWGSYKDKPLMARNATEERQASLAAQELRRVFDEASEGTRAANQRYREITEETINPALKSPMGRLATPRGAMPDREAAKNTLVQIFEKGTDPRAGGQSEILTLAKSFKKIDPSVFNDTAKTWLSGKLADAVKITEDGVIDPSSMASIKASLYTTQAQRQGMRDVLAGMADNADLPRARVVGAFEGFMDVLSKTAKRPATVGGLPIKDILQTAGKSKLADAIRFWGFTANMTAGRRIEEKVLGRTLSELDELLTTKAGVEYLQILAQDGYVSKRAIVAGATALQALREATPEKDDENSTQTTQP